MAKFKVDNEQIDAAVETLKTLLKKCEEIYEKEVPVSDVDKGQTHDELITVCENIRTTCYYFGQLIHNTIEFLGKSSEMFQESDKNSADNITDAALVLLKSDQVSQMTARIGSTEEKASSDASLHVLANGLKSTSLSNDDETEQNKVKIGDGDEPADVVNSTKDAVIDNRRKDQGREGKKEEHERYVYSSSDSGSVSILGTDFRYDKYTDYTGGSISTTDGDRFYSADTAFGKEGTHIDFESTDGSGLSGDITMNGITAYGTGEFDLAKGNAYIKAGADYSMYSLTVESQGDMGGFSLTGEVGAGLHLDAGIHDGKITVDAGVALGLGVGFSIEFDYRAFWDATCNAFGF